MTEEMAQVVFGQVLQNWESQGSANKSHFGKRGDTLCQLRWLCDLGPSEQWDSWVTWLVLSSCNGSFSTKQAYTEMNGSVTKKLTGKVVERSGRGPF